MARHLPRISSYFMVPRKSRNLTVAWSPIGKPHARPLARKEVQQQTSAPMCMPQDITKCNRGMMPGINSHRTLPRSLPLRILGFMLQEPSQLFDFQQLCYTLPVVFAYDSFGSRRGPRNALARLTGHGSNDVSGRDESRKSVRQPASRLLNFNTQDEAVVSSSGPSVGFSSGFCRDLLGTSGASQAQKVLGHIRWHKLSECSPSTRIDVMNRNDSRSTALVALVEER